MLTTFVTSPQRWSPILRRASSSHSLAMPTTPTTAASMTWLLQRWEACAAADSVAARAAAVSEATVYRLPTWPASTAVTPGRTNLRSSATPCSTAMSVMSRKSHIARLPRRTVLRSIPPMTDIPTPAPGVSVQGQEPTGKYRRTLHSCSSLTSISAGATSTKRALSRLTAVSTA